ncbi:cell division protein FtsI [Corynebacterium yudongzhengii]|uniref:Cell division protein FtsI n=1 Tax=Corynebacterium yudongzhengii TaxID=2080740 RepID=A0A2U1T6G0_9CORY|nr:penicillin-binding transpeptidase domain-containing protein [Corynebacterium yudongzhengii]AWB82944.1 cell division protein FtsI [Corynebacterium yudongzhengii]PWC01555.1 cell division protein FtsI [Corynebacterium yudongzhengii]
MKRLMALAMLLAVVCAGTLVACTPRPASAEPVAESFLEALTTGAIGELLEIVDRPDEAEEAIVRTREGLQVEQASFRDLTITHNGDQASANYTLSWQLPRERVLEYPASLLLTKTQDEWTVRWQPSLLHPELGTGQHLELRTTEPEPASIVSSDGVALMSPGTVGRVLVDTNDADDPRATAATITSALNAVDIDTPDNLARDLAEASGTYSVTTVPDGAIEPLERALADTPGVRINEEAAMVADDPGFAPDTLARVGEIVGKRLIGEPGWSVDIVNEHGASYESVQDEPPAPAPAVEISLDYDVQRAAERSLGNLAGRQAVIVAMKPSTGQVLAVTQTEDADAQGNIGLTGQYPPGSTFKILTAAAAVDRLGLAPGSIVGCPGSQDIYGRIVVNYNQFSLGSVPLERAFAQSCNTTFADLSTQLAPGELEETSLEFGLGIDYDIPGLTTATGSVPHGDEPLERTEAGYGQGHTLASPLGMALVSATAAAGTRPTPTLIDGEPTTSDHHPPNPNPEVIAAVQQMMRSVVTSGTAAGMSAQGEIHGKTGEAEYDGGSHSWFTGYRDDLAFATLVVGGAGSELAVQATDQFLRTLDELRSGGDVEADAAGAADAAVAAAGE